MEENKKPVETDTHELDLHLSSNIKDVLVHHFILDWSCNWSGEKCITLFLSNLSSSFLSLADNPKNSCDHVSSNNKITNVYAKDFVANSNSSLPNSEKYSVLSNSSVILDETQSPCDSDDGCIHNSIKTSKEYTTSEKSFQSHEKLKSDSGLCMNRTNLYFHEDNTKNVPENHRQNTNIVEALDTSSKNLTESNVHVCNKKESGFVFTLDACDLEIVAVEEVILTDSESLGIPQTISERKTDIRNDQGVFMSHVDKPGQPLQFEVQKHCVNISKPGVFCVREFPRIFRIRYFIKPDGKSFKWTKDADGRDCGFTIGHWINNRSIFPSQDAPSAMPTWQAIICAPKHLTVLMSGDEDGRVIDRFSTEETNGYFFYTSMPMPTSTLAIAFGEWNGFVISESSQHKRVFATSSLKEAARSEMSSYLPSCLQAVKDVLGPHPFQRLDILIVPECFDSLGMASPSLLFLSQSVLSGNFSMFPRVSHELCHSWFGLLIGPRDWTEEWLTEGFCTYLEDIVHCKAMKWSDKFTEAFIELRAILRYKTLYSEVQHTDETLQMLRPNQGSDSNSDDKFVKNGMNPEKAFMQVHYLKGYFLLCYLEKKVGREKFLAFLKEYVVRFHGELVSSEEFIGMFFECFPEIREMGLTEESLSKDWLDHPGIHDSLASFAGGVGANNSLIAAVNEEVQKINVFCERLTKKSNKRRRFEFKVGEQELIPDQFVLLLEQLLERKKLPEVVFTAVRERCSSNGNAEVSHRLCELIVKHKFVKYYPDVEIFLEKHQAMGVYLYGEMMLSSNRMLIELARKCFTKVQTAMPDGVYNTVYSMLYG